MLRIAYLVLYLSYVLMSGSSSKQGSGLDPLGLQSPPPPPTSDQGSGLDPLG
jgi:hypothetical protein